MQILGIYLNKEYSCLKEKWYGFYSEIDWHEKFLQNEITKELINTLINYQDFQKTIYKYNGGIISICGIVGKNGAGKSTLLELYNKIINNFAYTIKNNKKFKKYNQDYELHYVPSLNAELYYENNQKVYCIKVDDNKVMFLNNEIPDLFDKINSLKDLAEHCFYTIATNYSLYYKNEEWLQTLFHKNDGYFTPIVLVPFRNDGNIEFNREKNLAEKRVMTLSLLLYKESKIEFMENYIPFFIRYELKTSEYYKKLRYANLTDFKNYEEEIKFKINKLKVSNENKNDYRKNLEKEIYISNEQFSVLQKEIESYWGLFFKSKKDDIYNYCRLYLIYKTLKSFINYESVARLLNFDDLPTSLKSIIKTELWNENNINYINLKILTCKRFIMYTYKTFYKGKDVLQVKDFLSKKKIKETKNYHEIFSYLLPDFFDVSCYYKKTSETGELAITLSNMSSGQQQLYNSLSYIVYHMKNAQSNQTGNSLGKIPYKSFNLIIDEAELYYHPEYQRRFITDLINLLNRSNIACSGLNIIIVTHSPYIISDIPRNAILALDAGKKYRQLNETLAANIYDLLENQFFMTSTIGECSKKMIETIIEYCNNVPVSKSVITSDKLHSYTDFIESIGDKYLKLTLRDMLKERQGEDFYQRTISKYEEQIKLLKKQQAGFNEEN